MTLAADTAEGGRAAQVGRKRVRMTRGSTATPSPGILFDPQSRAATLDLKAAVRALAAHLETRERDLGLRKRARTDRDRANFKLAVEALACNLAGLLMLGLDRPLAVPRSSALMWAKSRYHSPVYGQHFLDALAVMAHPEVGLIEDVARGFKFAGSTAQRSTVRPTPAFAHHVPFHLVSWDAFTLDEEREVLILKGHKDPKTGEAEMLDYRDTPHTRRRRKEVQRINAYLSRAPLIITATHLGTTEDGQPVDPRRRTVRRIFNNGSWHAGGRLYDGFWETMRREDRFRFLRIGTAACPEGEPIANVDHGQLFVRLAYHEAGLVPPEGDLYDIAGDGSDREGWKRLTNVVLLASTPPRNWPEGLPAAFPKGTKLRDAFAAITGRHAPIAHLFGTGVGFKLTLLESEMLIEVLLRLFSGGVTALPLHDSVLVAASDAVIAEAAMGDAFGAWTGGLRASLKTTFAEPDQGLGLLRLL